MPPAGRVIGPRSDDSDSEIDVDLFDDDTSRAKGKGKGKAIDRRKKDKGKSKAKEVQHEPISAESRGLLKTSYSKGMRGRRHTSVLGTPCKKMKLEVYGALCKIS